MSKKSIIVGIALAVLGVVVTIVSDSSSATSLIPAFIGVVFMGLGVGGNLKPDLNHHFMHGATHDNNNLSPFFGYSNTIF